MVAITATTTATIILRATSTGTVMNKTLLVKAKNESTNTYQEKINTSNNIAENDHIATVNNSKPNNNSKTKKSEINSNQNLNF